MKQWKFQAIYETGPDHAEIETFTVWGANRAAAFRRALRHAFTGVPEKWALSSLDCLGVA